VSGRLLPRRATAWIAAVLITGVACVGKPPEEEAPVPRPNIVFIMADDLGYGDLGSYGQTEIATPNLDRLAAEGRRFTNVYTGSPVCAPSRSVLMTGKHTGHTTVRGNFGKRGGVRGLGGGEGRVPLRAEDVTVAEVLKAAGYATGMVGKWGLGEPDTTGEPNRQGWDEWFGYLNQRRAHSYYPEYLWHNTERVDLPGNANGHREQYSHDLLTERALGFVRDRFGKGAPSFLYLPYTVPHQKYEIPDTGEYATRDWEPDEKVHAAMITRMDADIGRLLNHLKAKEILRDTVVFFCSDNGAARRWEGRFDSSGALRGRKGDVYEGGIRTPMIVWWPGQTEPGSVSAAPWYYADVLPTLAELGGASAHVPEGIDGMSVVPTLLGQEQDTSDRVMYWEFHGEGFAQAVRWRTWKAVQPSAEGSIELYDLSTDPGETRDVSGEHPGIVDRLAGHLRSERVPSREWPSPIDSKSE
jgi:arylsulfatase A-like enzyme